MSARVFLSVGLLLLSPLLGGCQISYLLKSAKGQWELFTSRVSIEDALQDPSLDEEQKRKLRLAQEAREFGEQHLGLKKTKNYTQFVQLNRSAVTYVVSAAPAWELKHHQWSFPIVGKVPYKGYFKEDDAKDEEKELKAQGLDTYLRGVSAYSTLGWFQDPILSSMLRSKDWDLVNTIIHESTHATLFIKSSADFNERLATFIGNQGAEAFYRAREGADSPTVQKIHDENVDEKLFSEFMSKELKDLEAWYKTQPGDAKDRDLNLKTARIKEIQERYKTVIQPQMRTDSYKRFPDLELNNARLMIYKTYLGDLKDFAAVFDKIGSDFPRFIKLAQELEKAEKPEATLKSWVELSKEELEAKLK